MDSKRFEFELRLMQRYLVIFMLFLIVGCGFHMRQAVNLPPGMNSVYVTGFPPTSPFPGYLGQNLRLSDGRLATSRETAGFVLNAVEERFDRREVSLSETGKANVLELSYLLTFDLQSPDGETIAPPQTIKVVRDYFNPQIEIIGKSEEETVIRNEMYKEAVRSALRRAEVALQGSTAPR